MDPAIGTGSLAMPRPLRPKRHKTCSLYGRESRWRHDRTERGAIPGVRLALSHDQPAGLWRCQTRRRPARARRPGCQRRDHRARFTRWHDRYEGVGTIPARRIIPCLDVRDGKVVKGVQFRNHRIVGEIVDLADRYCKEGADELVFYDITASPDGRTVDRSWVSQVAAVLDIPFCVAGGIKTVADAEDVLNRGADKISINSPALANPDLISELATRFGSQCVVIGIDSREENGGWQVYQFTGDPEKTSAANWDTGTWVREVQERGAGEIVLNCMNQDGIKNGYDCRQLLEIRRSCQIPLIASGGAGKPEHFKDAFDNALVDGALAASVFHSCEIYIPELKRFLQDAGIEMRR